MNGLRKPFKKSDKNVEKTVNIDLKMPHAQKPISDKANFVQTTFSHST